MINEIKIVELVDGKLMKFKVSIKDYSESDPHFVAYCQTYKNSLALVKTIIEEEKHS